MSSVLRLRSSTPSTRLKEADRAFLLLVFLFSFLLGWKAGTLSWMGPSTLGN